MSQTTHINIDEPTCMLNKTKDCISNEEMIVIFLMLVFSCITMPVLSQIQAKNENPEVKKKIKLATILQFVIFGLVLLKIAIRHVSCNYFPVFFQNKPLTVEIVNLVTMLGLMICISFLNGLWWDFYYTKYAIVGRTYLAIFFISITCLSWIPFSLRATFFPKELTACIDLVGKKLKENAEPMVKVPLSLLKKFATSMTPLKQSKTPNEGVEFNFY